MENHCVICWAIIPEGRLVCPNCEKSVMEQCRKRAAARLSQKDFERFKREEEEMKKASGR